MTPTRRRRPRADLRVRATETVRRPNLKQWR
jgi:hypothetical protein